MEPFLRWAGSKKKLLPFLKSYWSESFGNYIEPFAGSACLFFSLEPKQAVIGDNNKRLVDTYLAIKSDPMRVAEVLFGLEISKTKYLEVRKNGFESCDIYERAANFIFLNRYCYNGLYRTNRNGMFNVPYSDYRNGRVPSMEKLLHASKLMENCIVVHSDFYNTSMLAKAGDFVYLDPPYSMKGKIEKGLYGPNSFSLNDIDRLFELLLLLDKNRIHFLLSYADCSEMTPFRSKWNVEPVITMRNISGFTIHRKGEKELLISNLDQMPEKK